MPKAEKNFLLVSLEEDKAKKLAQVISNDTCRKILDFLTKKESTETELSKELGIPISTVHYNLKQLSECGLVVAEEYHYSKKGREVNHYSLANKYIIIAPKHTDNFPQKLRHLIPVLLIISAAAFALKLFAESATFGSNAAYSSSKAIGGMSETAAMPMMAQSPVQQSLNFVPWFIYGALFALAAYFAYDFVAEKLKK